MYRILDLNPQLEAFRRGYRFADAPVPGRPKTVFCPRGSA